MVFGSLRQKINFDTVLRPQHAYSLLEAADIAKKEGLKTISVAEFGVATGSGLFNIAFIAKRISKMTGINFKIYGFDTGKGMPPAIDYRDHPEQYEEGDFKMDFEALRKKLPEDVTLILGEVGMTVKQFIETLPATEPLGFISVDVDYYYSTKDAFKVLSGKPEQYLPITIIYMDDIALKTHNHGAGQLLAVNEFNEENKFRKIERHAFFLTWRIFQRASWIKKIHFLHVMDHKSRSEIRNSKTKRVIGNPYL
jgi:hypothetical protein